VRGIHRGGSDSHSGHHASADVVALLRCEAELDVIQPVRRHAHVVVCRDDDLALGQPEPAVERGASSLFFLERIAQADGKRCCRGLDDLSRVVGGVVVHDDDFPRSAGAEARQALERVLEVCYGYTGHVMDFPGTINNDFEHFMHHVLDITKSLAYHGFKKIVLLNGHGSNWPNLDLVARPHQPGDRR